MKLGACAVLVAAGGAAGWQPQETKTSPPVEVRSVSQRSRAAELRMVSKKDGESLTPRPARISRSLDDVLETIQAGRLAPLIEFLPQATVADLRSIMAEDDLGDLSEGSGTFGSAHGLAALRWVEIDPSGAFEYGISRSDRLATRMLEHWMKMDSSSAAASFKLLPLPTRLLLARNMVAQNGRIADALALADPQIAWTVTEERMFAPDPEVRLQQSRQTVDQLMASPHREEPTGTEVAIIGAAFFDLAKENPEAVIAEARRLPWPGLRVSVLSHLSRCFNVASADLPPGPLRANSLIRETEDLMVADPDAALRQLREAAPGAERDAIYQAVAASLAGSDPWKLLDLVSNLPGQLSGGRANALEGALIYAGKNDPERALGYFPAICARVSTFGGPQEYAKKIVSGWLQKDPAAAIIWMAGAGLVFGHEELANAKIPQQVVVDLLSNKDPGVSGIARFALSKSFEESLTDGTVQELIQKVPQEETERWLKNLAMGRVWNGNYEGAMRIADEAPPLSRQNVILPAIVEFALRSEDGSGLKWLQTLSFEERTAIRKCMEARLNANPPEDADLLRETLRHLQP